MISVNESLCVGCGACAADCMQRNIRIEDGIAKVLDKSCFKCGHCFAICPTGALSYEVEGYPMDDVEEGGEGFGISPEQMLHALRYRRSVRQFRKDKLSRKEIGALLSAARCAPSSGNSQNVSYIVINDKMDEFNRLAMSELRRCDEDEELCSIVIPRNRHRIFMDDDDFLFKGATALILTVSPSQDNASLASANIEHMAAAMGIGVLYVIYLYRLLSASKALRGYLGLKDGDVVQTCMALGKHDLVYPRTAPRKEPVVRYF